MKLYRIFTIALSLTILPAGNIWAGRISDKLDRLIQKSPPDSLIEIFITIDKPKEQKADFKSSIMRLKSRRDIHTAGINHLKSTAENNRSNLVSELNRLSREGYISDIETYWLAGGVSAKVASSVISNLATRNDVDFIFLPPLIVSNKPTETAIPSVHKAMAGVEENLTAVGADAAWASGYDGTGRIICSFDTGVEGDHPALADNWKGLDGNISAAWYDPFGMTVIPQTFAEAGAPQHHGTHSMGIMIGHDEATGDTVGVAPGAKWIAAAVIDLPYVALIRAFEWAADPDGDPNTISDVPDVINHSWTISKNDIACEDYLGELIDNLEMLGVVNIFAAGNEGSSAMTVNYPANMADDSLDNFAVGSISLPSQIVTLASSRGPSDCDGISIKPNVVAPGNEIRSAYNGDMVKLSGTSMAAPHVSGAVAILRQAFPDASPSEIKEALLVTATPLPDAGSSPNNDYGWGLINIPAALGYLSAPTAPNLKVYSFDYTMPIVGETISEYFNLINTGQGITNANAEVISSDAKLNILSSTFSFGDINAGQIVQSDVQFTAEFDNSVEPGDVLKTTLSVTAGGGYQKDIFLYIVFQTISMDVAADFITHDNGRIKFTISNFGQYGFGVGSFLPIGKEGFNFDGAGNQLFEGALIIGYDAEHVSDGARNFVAEPDNDFEASQINIPAHGKIADTDLYFAFNDSYAENPMGIEVLQRSISWTDAPDNNFVILQYIITNISNDPINGLMVGLLMDWDIIDRIYNAGSFNAAAETGYMFYSDGTPLSYSDYRGLKVLNDEGIHTHTFLVNDGSNKLTEAEKFAAIGAGTIDLNASILKDNIQVMSTGPFNLVPGQYDTAAFAILAEDDLSGFLSAVDRAVLRYPLYTDIAEIPDDILPTKFELLRNYPNPFNPGTTIEFALPHRAEISLTIYNILGEKVTTLAEGEYSAGKYRVDWDGRDKSGKLSASGVYFYALKADSKVTARKMLLLK